MLRQVALERCVRAPVTGDRRGFPHDEPGHLRAARFGIVRRHAVVADLRAGHRHNLSGVRRIGQHLLIAGHASNEHDLAARRSLRANRLALVPDAVFERQHGIHRAPPRSLDAAAASGDSAIPTAATACAADTTTCRVSGSYPSRDTSISKLPNGTSLMDNGVRPRSAPPIITLAPGGVVRTSTQPVPRAAGGTPGRRSVGRLHRLRRR